MDKLRTLLKQKVMTPEQAKSIKPLMEKLTGRGLTVQQINTIASLDGEDATNDLFDLLGLGLSSGCDLDDDHSAKVMQEQY